MSLVDPREVQKSSVNWQLVYLVAAFVGGSLLSAGMGWGRSTTSIDNLTIQVSRLEGSISTLAEKYNESDKEMERKFQQFEDHLTYDDNRLDRLEGPKLK